MGIIINMVMDTDTNNPIITIINKEILDKEADKIQVINWRNSSLALIIIM